LISSGTELATLKKTPASLVKQTLTDPWMREAVKQVVGSSGLEGTAKRVWDELNLFRVIGYSGSGVVMDKGKGISHVKKGDRVAFAAQGHAEIVAPAKNHVVKIPKGVSFEEAAFVTVGGIAMQGVRRAEVRLGERVAVIGLGLVGQLTMQLVNASGGHSIGIDLNPERAKLARKMGCEKTITGGDIAEGVVAFTDGKGADCTIICAATQDPQLANQAMKMTRKQGRVVFIGLVKMDLERMPFFRNELDLRFSRAFGPGSYVPGYEKGRVDFPFEYVRWTESRNLEEFLECINLERVQVKPLYQKVFLVDDAQEAFSQIHENQLPGVAALLEFNNSEKAINRKTIRFSRKIKKVTDAVRLGVIGCGNFTRGVHLPNLSKMKSFQIKALCSASGTNAASVADRYKVNFVTSDYQEVLKNKEIDAILIVTRHNLHTQIILDGLKAGKHIFVEKPISLSLEDLEKVEKQVEKSGLVFTVGYNRRYGKLSRKVFENLTGNPVLIRYFINVQRIPEDHWTLDPVEGGGRLLGESDHFFDLCNFFAQSTPTGVFASSMQTPHQDAKTQYNFGVQIQYENQSVAQVLYSGFGSPLLPRERIEVVDSGQVFQINDFRELKIFSKKEKKEKLLTADMGHSREMALFGEKILTGQAEDLIDIKQGVMANRISLLALEAIKGTLPNPKQKKS